MTGRAADRATIRDRRRPAATGIDGKRLADELRAVVSDAHVLTDPAVCAGYETDWTGRFGGTARLVVRPATTSEVAAVVRTCARHNAALVPQGGNTGLVGGGVPRDHEVVLSTSRLTFAGPIDPALRHIELGAGVTLAALQRLAAKGDASSGLDLAARDTVTIGGLVACDAGGAQALRYGTARARVVGLEAVLANGSTIRRLNGLSKDNAGLPLFDLLIGSEGTLGVLTRVIWRLEPKTSARMTALIPFDGVEHARRLLVQLRRHAPALEAFDFLTDEGLRLVLEHQRRRSPVPTAPLYGIVELAAQDDPAEQLAVAFEAAGVKHAAIADDSRGREALWALREGHADALAVHGKVRKYDVGVPLAHLAGFLNEVRGAVASIAPDARPFLFGHLGDGNVHINVLEAGKYGEPIDDAVLRLALRCGGTISAEHGIGTAKARWLETAVGAPEAAAMRAVKQALDPEGLLNPGVIFA